MVDMPPEAPTAIGPIRIEGRRLRILMVIGAALVGGLAFGFALFLTVGIGGLTHSTLAAMLLGWCAAVAFAFFYSYRETVEAVELRESCIAVITPKDETVIPWSGLVEFLRMRSFKEVGIKYRLPDRTLSQPIVWVNFEQGERIISDVRAKAVPVREV
jgi:hypothetical protein